MPRFAISTVTAVALAALATGAASPAASPAARATAVDRAGAGIVHRQALDDPTIVAIFDAANTRDMETGQLAAKRGGSARVREFGAMLVRDHRSVRQQARDLAHRLGVKPTPPKDDQGARDHATAMRQLRALKGDAFDRAFVAHEIAYHQAVISAVQQTLLPAIRNAELKALVTKAAPAFQAHLAAAQQLQKQIASR